LRQLCRPDSYRISRFAAGIKSGRPLKPQRPTTRLRGSLAEQNPFSERRTIRPGPAVTHIHGLRVIQSGEIHELFKTQYLSESGSMKGILVRIGVHQAYGGWNAPVDPRTGQFVFIPIPDGAEKEHRPGNARRYDEIIAPVTELATKWGAGS
jgi:hypothetical protein